jgi:hypothetical protein
MYEEDSQIPFIEIPENEKDPSLLFIFLNRRTGETEPGPDGEELPVLEMDLRQYVDMSILKSGLTESEYDKVRGVLGLLPLSEATKKGKQITANVDKAVSRG